MITVLIESLPLLRSGAEEFGAAVSEFVDALMPDAPLITISRGENLVACAKQQESVFILREGQVTLSALGQIIVAFEPPALIGLERMTTNGEISVNSGFAVRVQAIKLSDLFETLAKRPELIRIWSNALLAGQHFWSSCAHVLCGRLSLSDNAAPPQIVRYAAGETIIIEGDSDATVYTLIEGRAAVTVNGVTVGEVRPDEIFGAIAALAGVPRTASVVATDDSLAIALPKEEFISLLQSRPSTVLTLINDMARALSTVNEKVVQGVKRPE